MATIRDVAKLAGVGIGTVSRVISGKGSVSQKTRNKVNSAMAALKFIPMSKPAQTLPGPTAYGYMADKSKYIYD